VNAAETLRADEVLDLDPGRIEAALRALWQEAAERSEGPPVARVQVLNLIVYTEDAAGLRFAEEVLDLLPERHPGRVIVRVVDPEHARPLNAAVSARSPAGRTIHVCAPPSRTSPGSACAPGVTSSPRPWTRRRRVPASRSSPRS
jgi:hypothetical protein